MKKLSLGILLFLCIFMAAGQPADARADDDRDDDGSELEVEAKVYTDITVVKVELSDDRKYQFTTEADTEAAVIDVVADKFDLSKEAVAAALEFEVEDRASRTTERGYGKDKPKHRATDKKKDRLKVCRDDGLDALEVEADIFTDTTIVKVELASGTKKVFETDATSTDAIADEVADRYDLELADVKAVIEVEVEDRASKTADRAIAYNPAGCDDDRAQIGKKTGTSTPSDAELRAQVAELQKLLNSLIRLFSERFGNL